MGRGFVTALAESISNSRTFEFKLLDGSSVTLVVRKAWKERQLIRLLEERFKCHPTEPLNALINPRVNVRPLDLDGHGDLKHDHVMQVEPDENWVSKVFVGYRAYSIKLHEGKYIMSREDGVKPGPSYVDPKKYCQKLLKEFYDYDHKRYASKVPMPRYHPHKYVSYKQEKWSMVFTRYLGSAFVNVREKFEDNYTYTFEFKLSKGEKKCIVLKDSLYNCRLARSLDEAFEKNPAIIHYLLGDIEQGEGIHYPYCGDILQFVKSGYFSLSIVFEGREYYLTKDLSSIDTNGEKVWSDSRYLMVEVGKEPSYVAKIKAWEAEEEHQRRLRESENIAAEYPPDTGPSDAYYERLDEIQREQEREADYLDRKERGQLTWLERIAEGDS